MMPAYVWSHTSHGCAVVSKLPLEKVTRKGHIARFAATKIILRKGKDDNGGEDDDAIFVTSIHLGASISN
jgi:hypothetical protein